MPKGTSLDIPTKLFQQFELLIISAQDLKKKYSAQGNGISKPVRLKQDVPLFLASMWNSVSSRAGPWLLSPANGERVQADKAQGICSTFLRPFKQQSESKNVRLWVRWLQCQSHYCPKQLPLSQFGTLHMCPAELVWNWSAAMTSCNQGFSIDQFFKLVRLVCFYWVKSILIKSLSPVKDALCVFSVRFPAVCLVSKCQL